MKRECWPATIATGKKSGATCAIGGGVASLLKLLPPGLPSQHAPCISSEEACTAKKPEGLFQRGYRILSYPARFKGSRHFRPVDQLSFNKELPDIRPIHPLPQLQKNISSFKDSHHG